MSFPLWYHPDVVDRDIPALDVAARRRVRAAIESRLTEHPEEFGKPLRSTLKGLWSLRVGDWRVVYRMAQAEVHVLRIGHRREVYDDDALRRRAR